MVASQPLVTPMLLHHDVSDQRRSVAVLRLRRGAASTGPTRS